MFSSSEEILGEATMKRERVSLCVLAGFLLMAGAARAEFIKQSHPWSEGHGTYDEHVLGDFNGDGMTDLLLVSGDDPASRHEVQIWLSNGSRFLPPQVWGSGFMPAIYLFYGDFNGDGRMDIVSFRQGSQESNGGMRWGFKAMVWLSTGNGFSGPSQWSRADFWRRADTLGDFDGDGKTDVLDVQNGTAYLWRSKGSSFERAQEWGSGMGYRLLVLDADGDGVDDFLESVGGSQGILWLSRSNRFVRQPAMDLGGAGGHCLPGRRVGDFNGDGREDVLSIDRQGEEWVAYVSLSEGNTLGRGTRWGAGFDCDLQIGDFNGDGRADALSFTDPRDWTQAEARVWLSTGTGFRSFETWSSGHRNWGKLGDFNGDGKTDFAQWAEWKSWIWLGH